MNVRYVAGVSWPRSGHHIVERVLQAYFGPDFVYCAFYQKDVDCCRTFPCARTGVHFTKNHDIASAAVPIPGVPYLIQYRSVMAAAVSDFELYLRSGHPDTAQVFERFATARARGWGQFVRKWIDEGGALERCILRYEDLTSDPLKSVSELVRFFAPTTEVDADRLSQTIAASRHRLVTKSDVKWTDSAGITQRRRVEDFRFYDRDLFDRIEMMAEESRRTKPGRA